MPAEPSLFVDLPLFASLKPKERALLAEAVDYRTLRAREVLFHAGDPGHAMFAVASGAVAIHVTDHAGQKIELTVARKGDVFGELALLDEGPRSATAIALEDTELLELDRQDLLLMIAKRPETALHLLGSMGAMTRKADMLLRTRVARNPNEEIAEQLTLVQRIADWIADFSGSMSFLALNALWFGLWIWLNVSGMWRFDPYPFGLLTMIVSLQAIFLSIFVLLAQNRQASKDRIRADIEYEINVKAELEVAHLHEKLDGLREELLQRLARLEAATRPPKA
ncbi:MAG TPA: DUF1003 domain-containing protein [Holophagaceae bacterium]|nr:DUF1003 domain-containing protein [Holophagaceae bacterium]